jgi:nitrate/nitrite transporter NarK
LEFVVAATSTLPIFLAADLGNLVGGGLVKVLTLRGWSLRRARGAVVTLAAAMIVPTAGLTHVQSVSVAVGLLACAAAGLNAILANYTALQQDLSFAHVGLVAGLLGMASNVASATVNPWIGNYVDGTGSYHLVFVLLGLLPLVALAAMLSFEYLIAKKGVAS